MNLLVRYHLVYLAEGMAPHVEAVNTSPQYPVPPMIGSGGNPGLQPQVLDPYVIATPQPLPHRERNPFWSALNHRDLKEVYLLEMQRTKAKPYGS